MVLSLDFLFFDQVLFQLILNRQKHEIKVSFFFYRISFVFKLIKSHFVCHYRYEQIPQRCLILGLRHTLSIVWIISALVLWYEEINDYPVVSGRFGVTLVRNFGVVEALVKGLIVLI